MSQIGTRFYVSVRSAFVHCSFEPRILALYELTRTRQAQVDEVTQRDMSLSLSLFIAQEIMFQRRKCSRIYSTTKPNHLNLLD